MAVESARPWVMPSEKGAIRWPKRLSRLVARVVKYRFTSIAGRIVVLNVLGLVFLVAGILFLNQYRANLIDTRGDNLLDQGRIIATAIAEKITVDQARLPTGADFLQQFSARDGIDGDIPVNALTLNPEQLTLLVRGMAKLTGMRARVYDVEGNLIVDSQRLSSSQVLRFDLPPVTPVEANIFEKAWLAFKRLFINSNLPEYKDIGGANGKAYAEVGIALNGEPTRLVRVSEKGETVVTAAVPIQRMKTVVGALMLVSPEGEIDALIAKDRITILSMAFLVVAVTAALSMLLAGTIAGPMHKLAAAAERLRTSTKLREPIPDFSHRSDEIGHLSRALHDMTSALFRRMDATESFAADVAHELKNPLTSLRSAADTLPLVKTDEDRARLIGIIQHDVRRMNRLITDISDASRLDAELAREGAAPIDVAKFLEAVTCVHNGIHRENMPEIVLKLDNKSKKQQGATEEAAKFLINGHESRLSQVINNIVDNAISFSPKDGKIYISARRARKAREIEITIEDEGPGIPPENLDKIFTRFYTDRPAHEEFGQNSGLGLHISQQIVLAHGGRIWAENRITPVPRREGSKALNPGKIYGARFVIRLPAV